VLDTNVLIDGVKDYNSAAWTIIDQVLKGRTRAFFSNELRKEYQLILSRNINDQQYRDRIGNFLATADEVELDDIPHVVSDDHEDDKVLATAVVAEADALVTEDHHLLDLDPYGDLRILKPQEFLNIDKDDSWDDFARMIGLK